MPTLAINNLPRSSKTGKGGTGILTKWETMFCLQAGPPHYVLQSDSAKLINTPAVSLNKNICKNVNIAEKNQNSIKITNQNAETVSENTRQSGDLKTLKKADKQAETLIRNTDNKYSTTMEENACAAENQMNISYLSTTKITMDTMIEENTAQDIHINCALKEDSQIPIKSSAITAITQNQYMENAHIKLKQFDLFAGYGGFTIAGERCGFETIGFSEIDKYANAVLKYHYPNITNYYDITKINWAEVPDFDLLTGGSPCQDLSIAGKRRGLEGERSGLFYEYMRAVREKKPKYFIWENVKGALSSNQGRDFAFVLNEMAEAGYSLWWQVLNAKDFGVPQNRERIFVIGFRDGSPREVFFERGSDQVSDKQNEQRNAYCLNAGGDKHRGTYVRDLTTRETMPTLHSGGNGGVPSQRIMLRDGRDNRSCLRSGRNTELGVSGKSIRRLTPTECERLMGLPDGWTKYGLMPCPKNCPHPQTPDCGHKTEISSSQRYKLCGNGVVVNVVEEIIKQLINQPLT